MKKHITITILGIMMMAGVMAIGVMATYGGTCQSIDISTLDNPTNIVYTVVGNSSNMTGMNVTNNNTHIDVCFEINYKPDNFTLVFFDNLTKEVAGAIDSGGRGSRTRYVDRNVTVYVPEYINTTNEVEKVVEVEKIVKVPETLIVDRGYMLWQVLTAIVVGGSFVFFIMWKKKQKSAEEIVAEI